MTPNQSASIATVDWSFISPKLSSDKLLNLIWKTIREPQPPHLMPDFAVFITKEQARIACAEILGWKWYRHPRPIFHEHKFLALPIAHEFHQNPEWMVAADGSEFPCSIEYMEREFHLPDYPESLNAMRSAILTLCDVPFMDKDGFDWSERCEYLKQLEAIVFKATGKAECQFEIVNATAEQQCEAFLRVKGKFMEEII